MVVATVVVPAEMHSEQSRAGLVVAAATTSWAALTRVAPAEIRPADPSRDLAVGRNHPPVSSRPLSKKLSTFAKCPSAIDIW